MFKEIKKIIEFCFVYFVYLLLQIFPIRLVSVLGGVILKFLGPFTRTNKIVIKNYLQIFPLAKEKEIQKQTKKSWSNTGKVFFELLILPKIISQNDRINIKGLDNLEDAIKNKEKIIFIGIHEGNWEILLPTINKIGISVGGIYRHINNPYINKLILKIRKKSLYHSKSFYTPKGKQSAKEIIGGIKRGLSMVLLIDQKDSAGEIVPLFNIPVKTQLGFLKISKKYKMKIIPVHNKRDINNNFTIEFAKPINNLKENISDIDSMCKIHELIEIWIKEDPANYFLQHNRFG